VPATRVAASRCSVPSRTHDGVAIDANDELDLCGRSPPGMSRMDRLDFWPDLRAERVVSRDDAIVAIDKPSGVPTQAATQDGVPDDLPTRVKGYLGAKYLGVHQRLDRATSGVIVYTLAREANRGLAEQLESRTAHKRYLACVARWPKNAPSTLRHTIAEGDDGAMQVVPHGSRQKGAQLAITHVEKVERDAKSDRAMITLRLETGRTHQARVQLAAVGAAIAGDRIYAKDRVDAAPRLMLHASSIALTHPIEGRSITAHAPTPRSFARWLARGDASPLEGGTIDEGAFDDAIDRAREERFALGRAGALGDDDARKTTAFRLSHEEGDGVPNVALDVYGDHLVAHLYPDDATPGGRDVVAAREALLDRIHALGFDGVYLKVRPKQANVADTRSSALAPAAPVRGRAAPDEFSIVELGVPYLVRLGDGLSTGIFLDQRENRRRVRAMSAGKRVLNLFAYTGPFTVAAAVGGASRTVSVDASKQALDRMRKGLALAGVDDDRHVTIDDDVFAYLDRARRKNDRFDVVILDPPSYSSVGGSRFTATAYPALAAKAMALVAKDGVLIACSNHRGIVRAKLRRYLHEAARGAGRRIAQMKDLPFPSDFPAPFAREPHLKSLLVRLA
jgi:23S rRNA (cytosine1962-C5)-methyltransferase